MKNKVAIVAVKSRLLVFFIQYVSNILIEDHDAKVFLYPQGNNTKSLPDEIFVQIFGGFLRWDGQYFIHIAKYGYTYENTVAFFPLFPLLIKNLSVYIQTYVTVFSFDILLLLSALIINCICFVLAARALYTMSNNFFSTQFSYKVALLFCFNPASIFFTAPYSESLFCYLTFLSLINCLKIYKKYSEKVGFWKFFDIFCAISVSLTCVTRSNGILNIGFLCYTFVWILFNIKFTKIEYLMFLFHVLLNLFICFSLFIAFQIFCYKQFCTDFPILFPQNIYEHAIKNSFILPGQFSKNNQSWCYKTLPLAYSYVQNHYWEVGLFQYYKLKNIPQFALAFPVVYLVATYSWKFFRYHIDLNKNIIKSVLIINLKCDKDNNVFKKELMVYVVHAAVLVLFCVLCIHVQVTTRMVLSASPVVYWYCASVFDYPINMKWTKLVIPTGSKKSIFVCVYFFMYFVVGIILFCNFLPWT